MLLLSALRYTLLQPAGGALAFMDRLFFSTLNTDKTMKVGAAVVSCRRGGNTATFDALNKYFTMTGMAHCQQSILEYGAWRLSGRGY